MDMNTSSDGFKIRNYIKSKSRRVRMLALMGLATTLVACKINDPTDLQKYADWKYTDAQNDTTQSLTTDANFDRSDQSCEVEFFTDEGGYICAYTADSEEIVVTPVVESDNGIDYIVAVGIGSRIWAFDDAVEELGDIVAPTAPPERIDSILELQDFAALGYTSSLNDTIQSLTFDAAVDLADQTCDVEFLTSLDGYICAYMTTSDEVTVTPVVESENGIDYVVAVGFGVKEITFAEALDDLADIVFPVCVDATGGDTALGIWCGPRDAGIVPDHLYNIVLGRPTNETIVASVLSYEDMSAYLSYGTVQGLADQITDTVELSAGEPYEFLVDGLVTDTQYFYQLNYSIDGGVEEASAEYAFQTPRSVGGDFVFTVQSDSHLDESTLSGNYAAALTTSLGASPDFHLALGDTFMVDKYNYYKRAEPQFLAQRYYFGSLLNHSAPLFFALGNHDGEGTTDLAMADWAKETRNTYFPNPAPNDFYTGNADDSRNYYAWEWGNSLFVALDPFAYSSAGDGWNSSLGQEQYDWLVETLENSTATFKFVYLHNLVGGFDDGRGGIEASFFYEWGGQNEDGTYGFDTERPGWGSPIHDVLAANDVTLVFHGHDHMYIHQERDGVDYQLLPQPGVAGGGTNNASRYGYESGDIVSGAGSLIVSVSASEVTVEFIDSRDGRVGNSRDLYTIVPPDPIEDAAELQTYVAATYIGVQNDTTQSLTTDAAVELADQVCDVEFVTNSGGFICAYFVAEDGVTVTPVVESENGIDYVVAVGAGTTDIDLDITVSGLGNIVEPNGGDGTIDDIGDLQSYVALGYTDPENNTTQLLTFDEAVTQADQSCDVEFLTVLGGYICAYIVTADDVTVTPVFAAENGIDYVVAVGAGVAETDFDAAVTGLDDTVEPDCVETGSGGGSAVGGYCVPRESGQVPDHLYNIVLGRPTNDTMIASVLSYEEMEAYIVYGTTEALPDSSTPTVQIFPEIPQEFLIEGLETDTQYYYQLKYTVAGGIEESSPEYSFHTPRSSGSNFAFSVQADSHLDENTEAQVYIDALTTSLNESVDFHLALGDTFMTDKYVEYELSYPQYLAQRYYFGGFLNHSAPLFFALGNHDAEGATDLEMTEWARDTRNTFFPNPAPNEFYTGNVNEPPPGDYLRNYYAWEWGNSLFVALDPFAYSANGGGWNSTLGQEQYDWLVDTLENSDATFKFVYLHNLVGGFDSDRGGAEASIYYEWGGLTEPEIEGDMPLDEFDVYRPTFAAGPIHDVLVANDVSAVFHGHDHMYIYQQRDDVVYQLVQQPGHPGGGTNNATRYGYVTGEVVSGSGNLKVSVSDTEVLVEFFDSREGRVGDLRHSYVIPAPTP